MPRPPRPYAPPPYGQHFLHDRGLLEQIVSAAEVGAGDAVLEVGVGTGHLTRAILETGASVTGVEVDGNLFEALRREFAGQDRLRLVKGDILRIPWDDLLSGGQRWVLMGNLPYAISTQVLFRAIERRGRVRRAVFLVQWEVGRRMCAPPGGKEYGILSVACQLFGRPEVIRRVPPGAFLPPPRVDSALVRWDLSPTPLFPVRDEAFTRRVVRAAFGQRRKKLSNSLAAGLEGIGREAISEAIARVGLPEDVRAERLTVGQFAELSNRLGEMDSGRGGAACDDKTTR